MKKEKILKTGAVLLCGIASMLLLTHCAPSSSGTASGSTADSGSASQSFPADSGSTSVPASSSEADSVLPEASATLAQEQWWLQKNSDAPVSLNLHPDGSCFYTHSVPDESYSFSEVESEYGLDYFLQGDVLTLYDPQSGGEAALEYRISAQDGVDFLLEPLGLTGESQALTEIQECAAGRYYATDNIWDPAIVAAELSVPEDLAVEVTCSAPTYQLAHEVWQRSCDVLYQGDSVASAAFECYEMVPHSMMFFYDEANLAQG